MLFKDLKPGDKFLSTFRTQEKDVSRIGVLMKLLIPVMKLSETALEQQFIETGRVNNLIACYPGLRCTAVSVTNGQPIYYPDDRNVIKLDM